jgi:uncharacterized SAM-binding protein YcdF (DUF218 family)
MYDALVVLGGGVGPGGNLPSEVKDRVRLAVERFLSGGIGVVVMSGGYSYDLLQAPAKTEAQAMKDYAVTLSLPAGKIITEEESRDTIGNAYFTKTKVLIPHGWRKVLVLPAPTHSTERVVYTLKKIWGTEYTFNLLPAAQNEDLSPQSHEGHALRQTKEWLATVRDGDHKSAYAILKSKHPDVAMS